MKMSLLKSYYILLISINVGAVINKPRTYTVRKDLTEHCRRGVALSVFLGTHVTEASAQVLQFGQAVIPYSCFIAARTEAGNDIILVMQDMQDDQLQRACKDYAKQIIVYDIHDTYGGYWGDMPDFVRNPEPLPKNVYTLETMPPSTEIESDYYDSTEIIDSTTEYLETTSHAPTNPKGDTIAIDIPIVNISGRFLDPYKSLKDIFGITSTNKKKLQRLYQYQTTMYPIVQFSEESGVQPSYELEYNFNPFDESIKRLTSSKQTRPQHFWDLFTKTTRFKFSKYTHQDSIFSSKPARDYEALNLEFITSFSNGITNDSETTIYNNIEETSTASLVTKTYTKLRLYETMEVNDDVSEYWYKTISTPAVETDEVFAHFGVDRRFKNTFMSYTEKLTPEAEATTPSMVIDIPELKTGISESISTSEKPSVNLANRETWENFVLAAPKMASVLNMGSINETILDLDPSLQGVTLLDKAKRDKRYLQGISVKNMVPRPVTSESVDIKTEGINYLEMNLAEFGKNVERINEEAQSRVALRYPHRFLGKELFNLCDHKDLQTRHIFMFNSSRIWIELSNFSLDSISIVLTEARRVLDTDSFCEDDYLECQLSGSRVCIDALNACDGVPNCGAYDIYDEDRLKCGYFTPGMQQSVYIAAFAFLVLAHTIIYIIMYWLKRCVPKVSTAFFIYSEGAENMLNLQTIMKSPYFENTSISDASISDQNFEEIIPTVQNKKVSVYQILRDSFRHLWGGKAHKDQHKKKDDKRSDRASIFAPVFYNTAKYFEDTSVQTTINMNTFTDTKIDGDEEDELKILKFCRNAKCGCTSNSNETQIEGEPRLSTDSQESKNIPKRSSFAKRNSIKLNIDRLDKLHHNPFYTRTLETINNEETKQSFDTIESKDSMLITTTADVHPHSDKKLRFDEVAITIKNSVDEGAQRFSTEKLDLNLDKIEMESEPGTSKQSKLFWLGKKKKKSSQPPLPRPRPNK